MRDAYILFFIKSGANLGAKSTSIAEKNWREMVL
jgi:hypothetical protein